MEILRAIAEFFDNKSVAAFAGAFAAFALVIVNDWRRDRRKVRNLKAEVEMNLAHAKSKLETVRTNRALMREHNRVIPAPILKFNTSLIRELAAEVLDRLGLDQRRAIDALCYNMEATDGLLEVAHSHAKRLSGNLVDPGNRMGVAKQLLIDLGDAIASLKRVIEMCDHYINQRYEVIVTKQYDRRDYEEP